jgi:holo-[acyl-carrier protein] synthase
MPILGVGVDLVDIRRIERTLARFGDRFRDRVFTPGERLACERRRRPPAQFAMRYAAKEACAKALGTGFRQGVFWRDIEVFQLPSGKPMLRLAGAAAARLAVMTPAAEVATIDISLTDEYPYAQAFVVVATRPLGGPAPDVGKPPGAPRSPIASRVSPPSVSPLPSVPLG